MKDSYARLCPYSENDQAKQSRATMINVFDGASGKELDELNLGDIYIDGSPCTALVLVENTDDSSTLVLTPRWSSQVEAVKCEAWFTKTDVEEVEQQSGLENDEEEEAGDDYNELYGMVQEEEIVVGPNERVMIRVNVRVRCFDEDRGSAHKSRTSFSNLEGLVELGEKALKVKAQMCMSLLESDIGSEMVFRDCICNGTYYKDFTVWNRSECELWFRVNQVENDMFDLHGCDGWENVVVGKLVKVQGYYHVRLRVRFRAGDEWGDFEHEIELENVRNYSNSVTLRLCGMVRVRREDRGFVLYEEDMEHELESLDFGDCFLGKPCEKWICVENRRNEYLELTVQTKRRTDSSSSERERGFDSTDSCEVYFADEAASSSSSGKPDGGASQLEDPIQDKIQEDQQQHRRTRITLQPLQRRMLQLFYCPAPMLYERDDHEMTFDEEEEYHSDRESNSRRLKRFLSSSFTVQELKLRQRNFRVMVYGNGLDNEYVTMEARARVCLSHVTIDPKILDFGDCNIGVRKSASLEMHNHSPLGTTIRFFLTSKVVSVWQIKDGIATEIVGLNSIEGFVYLKPRESKEFTVWFEPRKVNANYTRDIEFQNLNSPYTKNYKVRVLASNMDPHYIIYHSLFYKLSLVRFPIERAEEYILQGQSFDWISAEDAIDFGALTCNGPSLRCLEIENVTDKLIKIQLTGIFVKLFVAGDENEEKDNLAIVKENIVDEGIENVDSKRGTGESLGSKTATRHRRHARTGSYDDNAKHRKNNKEDGAGENSDYFGGTETEGSETENEHESSHPGGLRHKTRSNTMANSDAGTDYETQVRKTTKSSTKKGNGKQNLKKQSSFSKKKHSPDEPDILDSDDFVEYGSSMKTVRKLSSNDLDNEEGDEGDEDSDLGSDSDDESDSDEGEGNVEEEAKDEDDEEKDDEPIWDLENLSREFFRPSKLYYSGMGEHEEALTVGYTVKRMEELERAIKKGRVRGISRGEVVELGPRQKLRVGVSLVTNELNYPDGKLRNVNASIGMKVIDLSEDDNARLREVHRWGFRSEMDTEKRLYEIPERMFPVRAQVARSMMSFAQSHINFGTIRLPLEQRLLKTIYANNESAVPLLYEIRTTRSISSGFVHILKHKVGMIRPFGWKAIDFEFKPTLPGEINETLTFHNVVDPGESRAVTIKAKVIKPWRFAIQEVEGVYDTIQEAMLLRNGLHFRNMVWNEATKTYGCAKKCTFVLRNTYHKRREYVLKSDATLVFSLAEVEKENDLSPEVEEKIEYFEHKLRIARTKNQDKKIKSITKKLRELRECRHVNIQEKPYFVSDNRISVEPSGSAKIAVELFVNGSDSFPRTYVIQVFDVRNQDAVKYIPISYSVSKDTMKPIRGIDLSSENLSVSGSGTSIPNMAGARRQRYTPSPIDELEQGVQSGLSITPRTLDMGNIHCDSTVEGEFYVSNVSEKVLRDINVREPKGVLSVYPEVIDSLEPGSTMTVHVRGHHFDRGGRKTYAVYVNDESIVVKLNILHVQFVDLDPTMSGSPIPLDLGYCYARPPPRETAKEAKAWASQPPAKVVRLRLRNIFAQSLLVSAKSNLKRQVLVFADRELKKAADKVVIHRGSEIDMWVCVRPRLLVDGWKGACRTLNGGITVTGQAVSAQDEGFTFTVPFHGIIGMSILKVYPEDGILDVKLASDAVFTVENVTAKMPLQFHCESSVPEKIVVDNTLKVLEGGASMSLTMRIGKKYSEDFFTGKIIVYNDTVEEDNMLFHNLRKITVRVLVDSQLSVFSDGVLDLGMLFVREDDGTIVRTVSKPIPVSQSFIGSNVQFYTNLTTLVSTTKGSLKGFHQVYAPLTVEKGRFCDTFPGDGLIVAAVDGKIIDMIRVIGESRVSKFSIREELLNVSLGKIGACNNWEKVCVRLPFKQDPVADINAKSAGLEIGTLVVRQNGSELEIELSYSKEEIEEIEACYHERNHPIRGTVQLTNDLNPFNSYEVKVRGVLVTRVLEVIFGDSPVPSSAYQSSYLVLPDINTEQSSAHPLAYNRWFTIRNIFDEDLKITVEVIQPEGEEPAVRLSALSRLSNTELENTLLTLSVDESFDIRVVATPLVTHTCQYSGQLVIRCSNSSRTVVPVYGKIVAGNNMLVRPETLEFGYCASLDGSGYTLIPNQSSMFVVENPSRQSTLELKITTQSMNMAKLWIPDRQVVCDSVQPVVEGSLEHLQVEPLSSREFRVTLDIGSTSGHKFHIDPSAKPEHVNEDDEMKIFVVNQSNKVQSIAVRLMLVESVNENEILERPHRKTPLKREDAIIVLRGCTKVGENHYVIDIGERVTNKSEWEFSIRCLHSAQVKIYTSNPSQDSTWLSMNRESIITLDDSGEDVPITLQFAAEHFGLCSTYMILENLANPNDMHFIHISMMMQAPTSALVGINSNMNKRLFTIHAAGRVGFSDEEEDDDDDPRLYMHLGRNVQPYTHSFVIANHTDTTLPFSLAHDERARIKFSVPMNWSIGPKAQERISIHVLEARESEVSIFVHSRIIKHHKKTIHVSFEATSQPKIQTNPYLATSDQLDRIKIVSITETAPDLNNVPLPYVFPSEQEQVVFTQDNTLFTANLSALESAVIRCLLRHQQDEEIQHRIFQALLHVCHDTNTHALATLFLHFHPQYAKTYNTAIPLQHHF